MYQVQRLPNGVTLATAEMPHMASVCLGIWVAVGGRYEKDELNGVSHFIEHLLFKGTKKRTSLEISQAVEGIGGYLNAFTTEEGTCFYSKARHDRLDELLEVLVDMFLNSTFSPVEIEKEREVIKEEVAMYIDQPHLYVMEVLSETMWPDHPLGRSLTGTPHTLDKIQRGDLVTFMKANYVASGTVIVAAGNVSHRSLAQKVAKWLPQFTPGPKPKFDPVREVQFGPSFKLVTRPVEQTQIALGMRVCSRHDPRRFALRLINTMLGENMSSRLFQVVREEAALAYSISSALTFFDDTGAFNISAGLDTRNVPQALRLIARELGKIAARAPSTPELRRARDYLVGQVELTLENTESQMTWVGESLLGYGAVINPEAVKKKLHRVTPSEIRDVAQEFLQPSRTSLAMVSPLKSDKSIRSLLDW